MKPERLNSISKAELESVEESKQHSFKVGKYEHAFFTRSWHYHPEFELMLITKGYGTRMVGDHFEKFEEGDLVLLGGSLPHAWISDEHFLESSSFDVCESIFIQFKKSVFGSQFIDIPELNGLRTILAKASRGVKILGEGREKITEIVKTIGELPSLEQLLNLIRALDITYTSDYKLLASEKFVKVKQFKSDKMMLAHSYIMQNFKAEITIETCAELLQMTPSSFCRFFKKQTNVTFSVYLNYIRINFAQKLLRNTVMPIKEIGYQCGFLSVAYFNQVFKKLTGVSPGQFRGKLS